MLLLFFLGLAYSSSQSQQTPGILQEKVLPSLANPAVHQFDEPNVVLSSPSPAVGVPLVLFLPGTNGKPMNALQLLNVVAAQGYRVIGLSYNDTPPGTELCPRNPNPNCFTGFHQMRVFGGGPAPVSNPYDETIEARLVSLLKYLNGEHPNAGWTYYLAADGHPDWSRIVVSGLSQGAGMAAFIAKVRPVYRVVLFSSPWDNRGKSHRPAPWLFQPAATPPERWWAERHVQENTTTLIAAAYRALRIPSNHILLFNQGLTGEQNTAGKNPYHGSTIRNPAYESQWRELFGTPSAN